MREKEDYDKLEITIPELMPKKPEVEVGLDELLEEEKEILHKPSRRAALVISESESDDEPMSE
jgi:hypothetical protein